LEEKLVSELDNPDKVRSRSNLNKKTLYIPSIEDFDGHESIKRMIISLSDGLNNDKRIIYFLIFIAAMEDNDFITSLVKEKTGNYEGYEHSEQLADNPFEMLEKDQNILDYAFKYALQKSNISMILYILDGADKSFLNCTIRDENILQFLYDLTDNTNVEILRLLASRELTLLNDQGESEAIPDLKPINDINANDINGNDREFSSENSGKSDLIEVSNRSLSGRNILEKTRPKMNKAEPSKGRNVKMRKKKNPFNKFLEKADIVEVAIRDAGISDEDEAKTITLLYEQLSIPTNETVMLFKLLIYYEQVQTFEMLLNNNIKNAPKPAKSNKLDDVNEVVLGRKDDDNVYDYDEIISDAFSYAISLNKLHIAFYLFKTYEEDVYGNKMLCIKSILNSFKNEDTKSNQVMYLEERLYILEKFMKFIEYKMALEYITVMHQEVSDDPNINFLVYSPNPLKIIVMLLNIVISISAKHQNLKFKAQKVRSTLCDVANGIIDTSTSMNEIKDMLLDKTYSGIVVIDLIEMLNIIEILTNPMMDSIVSNMYNGPYERESVLKKSTCYKIFEEQTLLRPGEDDFVSRSFKFVGADHKYI
jgi:hypothetical protein